MTPGTLGSVKLVYDLRTTTVSEEPCYRTVKFDYDSCTTTRDSSDAKFNDASSSSS